MDGLRAVSVILIFIFHNWQASWIAYKIALPSGKYLFNFEIFQRYGYIAIDSFFVLSGFGLFYPIARAMFGETKQASWKEFYIKRARRILPAYYVMLFILLIFPVFSYNIYNALSLSDIIKHFGTHMVFTHIYNGSTIGSVIPTAWTLGIEAVFYVCFPFIASVFKKNPLISFVAMFVIGQTARIITVGFFDVGSQSVSSFPLLYIDIFGWGMLSAYFVVYARNKLKNIDRLKVFMTALSVLSLVIVYYFIKWMSAIDFRGYNTDGPTVFRMLYRFIADGAFAAFLFTTSFSCKIWERKIWGNKFFVYLSTISYSFYLWHQNVHIFLKKINVPYTAQNPVMNDRAAMDGFVLLSVVISLLIATASTYLIEIPISRYGFKGCIRNIKSIIAARIGKKQNSIQG